VTFPCHVKTRREGNSLIPSFSMIQQHIATVAVLEEEIETEFRRQLEGEKRFVGSRQWRTQVEADCGFSHTRFLIFFFYIEKNIV
jgi:hypothetical protein